MRPRRADPGCRRDRRTNPRQGAGPSPNPHPQIGRHGLANRSDDQATPVGSEPAPAFRGTQVAAPGGDAGPAGGPVVAVAVARRAQGADLRQGRDRLRADRRWSGGAVLGSPNPAVGAARGARRASTRRNGAAHGSRTATGTTRPARLPDAVRIGVPVVVAGHTLLRAGGARSTWSASMSPRRHAWSARDEALRVGDGSCGACRSATMPPLGPCYARCGRWSQARAWSPPGAPPVTTRVGRGFARRPIQGWARTSRGPRGRGALPPRPDSTRSRAPDPPAPGCTRSG